MSWDWNLGGPSTDLSHKQNDMDDLCGQNPQFCFDIRDDVIEQEALNAIYCTQVLKIQVEDAASEIERLEPELASLKNDSEVELFPSAPPAESSNEIIKCQVGNLTDHQV